MAEKSYLYVEDSKIYMSILSDFLNHQEEHLFDISLMTSNISIIHTQKTALELYYKPVPYMYLSLISVDRHCGIAQDKNLNIILFSVTKPLGDSVNSTSKIFYVKPLLSILTINFEINPFSKRFQLLPTGFLLSCPNTHFPYAIHTDLLKMKIRSCDHFKACNSFQLHFV